MNETTSVSEALRDVFAINDQIERSDAERQDILRQLHERGDTGPYVTTRGVYRIGKKSPGRSGGESHRYGLIKAAEIVEIDV
jgi:hypothetical protein